VAAQAEGRVHHDRAVVVEGGRQKGNDPVEEDRDVAGTAHARGAYRPRLVRIRKAAARPREVTAEKAITAAASRAW
jgi:hypothetical protein